MILNKKSIFLLSLLLSILFIYIPFINAQTYEDFDTYTEYDLDNNLNYTSYHIDLYATRHTTDKARLYYDYGVNYFKNYTHTVDAKSDFSTTYSLALPYMLANDLGCARNLVITNKTYIGIQFYKTTVVNQIRLVEAYNSSFFLDTYICSANTWYYFTIIKTGKNLTCNIYSNSNRTTLLDTLYLNLHEEHYFRYVYGCNTYSGGQDYQYMEIDVENLNLFGETLYITFYFNEGGLFMINKTETTNGTTNTYFNGTILEFLASPKNYSYVFYNYTWDSFNSTNNPYNFEVNANFTVWCYFSDTATFYDYTLPIALLISFILIIVLLITAKRKWRK